MPRLLTSTSRTVAAFALLGATALGAAGTAAAAPADGTPDAPACATVPSTTITQTDTDAGHLHFTVTLTARPDTVPCTLHGYPTEVRLVDAQGHQYPQQIERVGMDQTVVFGPGHPVRFFLTSDDRPGGPTAVSVISRDGVSGLYSQGGFPQPTVVTGPLEIGPYEATGSGN